MFKLDGKYYHAASDLHGWNSSVAHVLESTTSSIQGAYTAEYTMAGTEMDYSHVTQTGFFVTVNGTKKHTVIFAGDRWADFAWNGLGYNQWLPVDKTGAKPQFHSLSQWQFNATTGEWRAGPPNNYILNPDIQADRVIVASGDRMDQLTGSGSSATVTNINGGANGSQYALQVGAAAAYSGGVRQKITIPAGTYTLGTFAKTTGTLSAAQVTVTDAGGVVKTLTIPASSGWTKRELAGIQLAPARAAPSRCAASRRLPRRRSLSRSTSSTRRRPRRRPRRPPARPGMRRRLLRRCARARSTPTRQASPAPVSATANEHSAPTPSSR